MSKTERLFELLQILRQYRYPVSGQHLADKLDISLRTVYRDIADLQALGADIEGEAGLGFQLKPGFMLPPLMFNADEIEAIVLGIRWVSKKTDPQLQMSAKNALSKICAVLPEKLQKQLEISGLMVGPGSVSCTTGENALLLRNSIQNETKISIGYQDNDDILTNRIIWPLGIAFFDNVRVVIAWCELREDFRHFRTDRIKSVSQINKRYTTPRQQLLTSWRKKYNIPEQ